MRRKGHYIYTREQPEGIISDAKIVSQLYRVFTSAFCLIKNPTFFTAVVPVVVVDVVVRRHPADFISVASAEGFRKLARLPRLQR